MPNLEKMLSDLIPWEVYTHCKQFIFLSMIVNSEEIISLVMSDGTVIILQIRPFLTNFTNPHHVYFNLFYSLSHNQRLRIKHWELPRLILFVGSQDNEAKVEVLRSLKQ